MNELALIFERIGIDTREVIEAASTKWNFHKYYPSPGVGGHCLPVDPYYLVYKAKQLGYHPKLITAGRDTNDYMPHHVVDMIIDGLNEVKKTVNGSRITLLGASYKANVGDLRETPTEPIIKKLKSMGADIALCDPHTGGGEIDGIPAGVSIDESIRGADCLVFVTEHDEFKNLILEKLKKLMKKVPVIIDTQGHFTLKDVQDEDIVYRRI